MKIPIYNNVVVTVLLHSIPRKTVVFPCITTFKMDLVPSCSNTCSCLTCFDLRALSGITRTVYQHQADQPTMESAWSVPNPPNVSPLRPRTSSRQSSPWRCCGHCWWRDRWPASSPTWKCTSCIIIIIRKIKVVMKMLLLLLLLLLFLLLLLLLLFLLLLLLLLVVVVVVVVSHRSPSMPENVFGFRMVVFHLLAHKPIRNHKPLTLQGSGLELELHHPS